MPRSCFVQGDKSLSIECKRWRIASPVSQEHLARFQDLPPLVVQLLYNRGIKGPGEADAFLSGRFKVSNPFQLKGMTRAVNRLSRAIR